MTEMPNKETLDFNRPEETKDFPVRTEGTSALKLDVADEVLREEKGRDAQIGEIREFVKPERPQAVLPLTNTTDAGVQRAPRGVVGPVGNQGRETSGGDRTGGRRKKGLGVRITAGVMAVVAGAGIGYGVFKDKINSFFGGGVDPNDLPPTYPVETPGEMSSQSENIESPTPSAEVTQSPSPEPTETPTPLFSEERTAELNQQITDFINNQGDFTKEKKSEMAIASETTEELGSTELGIVYREPFVEGYLFDYVEKDGSLILIMGFDGKDGKGFVTPIQIPLYFLEGEAKAGFTFRKFESNTVVTNSNLTDVANNKDTTNLFKCLDELKGDVMIIELAFEGFSGSKDDHTGVSVDYFVEHESKLGLAGKLVDSVATNEVEVENEDYHEGGYGNYEIIKLENVNDIENLDLAKVPLMQLHIYFYSK